MNSKTIYFEIMKNDTPGFNDESNNLDVIQVNALLEYCIFAAIWNRKCMLSCFILGNNFENNR